MSLPTQTFNGKTFTLYKGEKYFSRGAKRMHVYVWEFTNNKKVPKGFNVHHIDEIRVNNSPGNLELKPASDHSRYHASKWHKENPEWAKKFRDKGIKAARKWHKSKDGKEWHKKHNKEIWKHRIAVEKYCQQCGAKYKSRATGRSKYCLSKCNAQALRDRRKGVIKKV